MTQLKELEELLSTMQPATCICPECGRTKERLENYTCDLMNCEHCGASLSDKGLKVNTNTPMGNISQPE